MLGSPLPGAELRLAPGDYIRIRVVPTMAEKRDDNPLRLIVREFDGKKGPGYTAWRKELLDALAGKGDDDASLADTVMKKDRRGGLSGD